MKEGILSLAPIADFVPADVKALVEAEKARILSGEFDVFVGPINDNTGHPARARRRVDERRGQAGLRLAGRRRHGQIPQ
jgi:basic membrane lipoprotein Med (substrate-binding protein (PBP1-ABC) superfamily)